MRIPLRLLQPSSPIKLIVDGYVYDSGASHFPRPPRWHQRHPGRGQAIGVRPQLATQQDGSAGSSTARRRVRIFPFPTSTVGGEPIDCPDDQYPETTPPAGDQILGGTYDGPTR